MALLYYQLEKYLKHFIQLNQYMLDVNLVELKIKCKIKCFKCLNRVEIKFGTSGTYESMKYWYIQVLIIVILIVTVAVSMKNCSMFRNLHLYIYIYLFSLVIMRKKKQKKRF